MKEKLITSSIEGMNLLQIVRYYFPNMTDTDIYTFIWNETCYPFSTEVMLDQIYEHYCLSESRLSKK